MLTTMLTTIVPSSGRFKAVCGSSICPLSCANELRRTVRNPLRTSGGQRSRLVLHLRGEVDLATVTAFGSRARDVAQVGAGQVDHLADAAAEHLLGGRQGEGADLLGGRSSGRVLGSRKQGVLHRCRPFRTALRAHTFSEGTVGTLPGYSSRGAPARRC
jgi:hypothetical protein